MNNDTESANVLAQQSANKAIKDEAEAVEQEKRGANNATKLQPVATIEQIQARAAKIRQKPGFTTQDIVNGILDLLPAKDFANAAVHDHNIDALERNSTENEQTGVVTVDEKAARQDLIHFELERLRKERHRAKQARYLAKKNGTGPTGTDTQNKGSDQA